MITIDSCSGKLFRDDTEDNRSRDSPVGIATGGGLGAGNPGFESRQGQDFSLLHSVRTGSGAYAASYPTGTGVKRQGREADHSPPSSAEVKNGGAIPPIPQYVFMAWCLIN
jgi:hypothetical protein